MITAISPVVWSLNYHRRHLTTSQKAMVAARAEKLRDKEKTEAKERQIESASRAGKASGAARRGEMNVSDKRHTRSRGRASEKIGQKFGNSGRTIERGQEILGKGIPEVVEAVECSGVFWR